MQRAPSLRRQLERKSSNPMQHRGQACRRKKRVFFVVTLICLAAATFTGFYVVHLKRGSVNSQAARNAGVAEATTYQHEEDPSLQVVIVDPQPHTTQTLRGSGQLVHVVRDRWAIGADSNEQQEVLKQEAWEGARGRTGQHDDFVVVLSVDQDKQELLQSTEQLWQGLRLFVVSNESSQLSPMLPNIEHWAVYDADAPVRSYSDTATRNALGPFLAYSTLGDSFKWAYFGTLNTDTAFFPEAAARAVAGLDPDEPHFLTDNMWYADSNFGGAFHPHPKAPLCQPCSYPHNISELEFPMPKGCPCRPADLCTADTLGLFPNTSEGICGVPKAPSRTYSMHGDAGALDVSCVGADAMATACLWRVADIAATSPDPLWHPDGLTLFDASSVMLPDPTNAASIPVKVSRHLGNLMSAAVGSCRGLCQLEVERVVSLHLNGGVLGANSISAEVAKLFGALLSYIADQQAGPGSASFPSSEHLREHSKVTAAIARSIKTYQRGFDETALSQIIRQGHLAAAIERAQVGATEGIASQLLQELVKADSEISARKGTRQASSSRTPRGPGTARWGNSPHSPRQLPPTPITQSSSLKGGVTTSSQSSLETNKGYKLWSWWAGTERLPAKKQTMTKRQLQQAIQPLHAGDFVVAIATHKAREHILAAGRPSRQGVQTFYATNHEGQRPNDSSLFGESWGYYPDAKPLRSFFAGDPRAAMVPFLAYKGLNDSFKWLFYGDDDTVFFLEGAMNVVKDLDPNMPYFLTDNMWFSQHMAKHSRHPHQGAPQCTPCGYRKDTSALPFPAPAGCPCRVEELCRADTTGALNKPPKACGVPRVPARTYSMHGGAGALISVGMFRKVSYDHMHRCVQGAYSSGGDAFITECLWDAGYGMTNPDPLWHPRNLTMFDPSPPGPQPDDDILPKAAHTLGNLLSAAAGTCHGLCKLEVNHTVALHLRSRRVGSDEAVYQVTDLFSTLLARLAGREAAIDPELHATHRHDAIVAHIEDAVAVLQANSVGSLDALEHRSPEVQAMLAGAGSGAARVVARKLLDTIVREARDWEAELEEHKRLAQGPAPQTSVQEDKDCHEAAHLCVKPDKPTW
ncbi:hypothetical protein COCOBI_10-1760 [Coccomyxa sp. Obi]|nr:hypothetical protein COCOBI_10-1760 [Coccomyxa sp. Obi]